MKQALLIIDVQNDYFANGKMALTDPDKALDKILTLQRYFYEKNLPIYYIQHIKKNSNADFFVEGSYGAKIHEQLISKITKNDKIIIKEYPNSFFKTTLQNELVKQDIKQLVISGMMTHMCVDSTTRYANELGYQPILISDACATKDLQFKSHTIKAQDVHNSFLAALQNFSLVIETQDFLVPKVNK